MWTVGAHYRKPVAYTEETLEDAGRAVARVRELVRRLDPAAASPAELDALVERFFDHLADDFNTAAARGVLFEGAAEANRRLDAGERRGPGRLGERPPACTPRLRHRERRTGGLARRRRGRQGGAARDRGALRVARTPGPLRGGRGIPLRRRRRAAPARGCPRPLPRRGLGPSQPRRR